MIRSVRNFSVRILDADRFTIVVFQILDIKSNYLPVIVQEQVADLATNNIPVCKRGVGRKYLDCMGYGQSDRFMKTVQKFANHVGQPRHK
jgi:hypothetical protein